MATFGGRGAAVLADHRQAQQEETARLQSLRAAGVTEERQYEGVDWDAPHGAWLVPVPELLQVLEPDVTSGRAERGAFDAVQSARESAAADEAAMLMAAELRGAADDVLDEQELIDEENAETEHVDSSEAAAGQDAASEDGAVTEALQEMAAELELEIFSALPSAAANPAQMVPNASMEVETEGQVGSRVAAMLQRAEARRRASNEVRIGEQQWECLQDHPSTAVVERSLVGCGCVRKTPDADHIDRECNQYIVANTHRVPTSLFTRN